MVGGAGFVLNCTFQSGAGFFPSTVSIEDPTGRLHRGEQRSRQSIGAESCMNVRHIISHRATQ